jgi:hypothetical protein
MSTTHPTERQRVVALLARRTDEDEECRIRTAWAEWQETAPHLAPPPLPRESRWHAAARWLVMAAGTLIATYGTLLAFSWLSEWIGGGR